MKREIISTEDAPPAVGPYSQAVRVGDLVFTAGQLGLVPDTKTLAGTDIEGQTRQALLNLQAILRAAGSCLEQAVKVTVFLDDINEFPLMNSVYGEFFPEAPPARAAAQLAALPLGAKVMIDVVALTGDCERIQTNG
ncbi:MAG: Rid family detoxifying hydrolase [Anaerolineae bacterium]|jgi:2-iminobutanoate/2-iminopropanoate deaminase